MVSASHAAAAGGVTTMAALPNTEPPIDDVALVDFVARRARATIGIVNIYTYAAATKGMKGREADRDGPPRRGRRASPSPTVCAPSPIRWSCAARSPMRATFDLLINPASGRAEPGQAAAP